MKVDLRVAAIAALLLGGVIYFTSKSLFGKTEDRLRATADSLQAVVVTLQERREEDIRQDSIEAAQIARLAMSVERLEVQQRRQQVATTNTIERIREVASPEVLALVDTLQSQFEEERESFRDQLAAKDSIINVQLVTIARKDTLLTDIYPALDRLNISLQEATKPKSVWRRLVDAAPTIALIVVANEVSKRN